MLLVCRQELKMARCPKPPIAKLKHFKIVLLLKKKAYAEYVKDFLQKCPG